MTALRACVLFLAFAGVAFSVVLLRAEQTRVASRTLALESRRILLRRELWAVQAGVARLRTPGRVHGGVEAFRTELVSPAEPGLVWNSRLAGDAPRRGVVLASAPPKE